MKEKWTYDLQKKMADYEVPTIPEGLWENIDSALETGVSDKPNEQTTNTQHPILEKGLCRNSLASGYSYGYISASQ